MDSSQSGLSRIAPIRDASRPVLTVAAPSGRAPQHILIHARHYNAFVPPCELFTLHGTFRRVQHAPMPVL